ncbi:hypothetical protein B0H66DRAFT_535152 [Apodospora peruviana]|uniref:Uncharacterized protein n=1 Tax=Apodospora peruviana TaxID=516989 RepID=A0AAE0I2E7_9PEZI|nr:hypothetical protein B0H66DRAFT_535152 [Apodospora peruviana]
MPRSQTQSNFTKTSHNEPYPRIYPTRPELSQAGRTVLVTGASKGIGKAVAKNFALASAAKIIMVARGLETLEKTVAELKQVAGDAGSPTEFVSRACDIASPADVAKLWDELAAEGVAVDVLINNAAKMSPMRPVFDLGPEELWSQFEANVKGQLFMVDRFYKQELAAGRQKFLVQVSSQAIHMPLNPIVQSFPAYALTKAAGTLLLQKLAEEVSADQMQIVNFHPGVIMNEAWAEAPEEARPQFDHEDLPGQFAVWTASKEAGFLHGRFVWAMWDVDELTDVNGPIRKHIQQNEDFLRMGVVGLRDTNWAEEYQM